MEKRLTNGPLLDEKGELYEKGYAHALLRNYNRKDVKVGKSRIKEWDYYYLGNQDFGLALTIADNGYMDLLSVTLLDFKKKRHFYYNQKINLLKPIGMAKWGDKVFDFSSSYGALDWGRGVWTYKNTWYWSSLNGESQGHRVGWNLGYGFGDTSAASENVFYYDEAVYKLEKVHFEIPLFENGKEDFLGPWKILGSGLEASFRPILNRHSDTNLLVFRSNQNQVFGLFCGIFHAPERDISFQDVPGFAEKVYNRW